ncbi:glycosyltransferase, partial [Bordetella pertussis]|uniref:glycosyltransferase n=1 Tax=Bordetella pertussis TaxID=520 RepID=UPI0012B161B0
PRRERPDAVQTWMYHADLIGGVAARLAGIRAVAWGIRNSGEHLDRSSRSARLVLKLCARLSARLPAAIVCAAQDAATRHRQHGYDGARMVVIPNGYDLSRYAPDAQARERMLKDHANLLAALGGLVREGRDRGLQCALVGR